MLPHLEQDNYFRRFRVRPNLFTFWWQDPVNRLGKVGMPWDNTPVPRPPAEYACEGKLGLLLCPSAPAPAMGAADSVMLTQTFGVPGVDFNLGLEDNWTTISAPPDYSKKPTPADEKPYVPPHHHNSPEKENKGPTQLNPRTKSAQYRRSRAGERVQRRVGAGAATSL